MLRVSDGAGGQLASNDASRCLCRQPFQAGEMARDEGTENLSSGPGIHVVERANQILLVVL